MIWHRWCLIAFLVTFCTIAVRAASVKQFEQAEEKAVNRPWQAQIMQQGEEKNQHLQEHSVLDEMMLPEIKSVFKREAKRPKNKKRRLKFNKKKLQLINDDFEASKLDSKSVTLRPVSMNSDGEPAAEPEFSELYMPWNLPPRPNRSRHPKKDESDSDNYDYETSEENEDSGSEYEDSVSLNSTDATEEISLTPEETVESSEEIDSGPDSSPPNSSDSTDESSASKAISGGSSEISYTMSSSAEDAFPSFSSEMDKSKKKEEDISYTMGSSASVYSSSEEDKTREKFETDENSVKKEKDAHHPHDKSSSNEIPKNESKSFRKPILAADVLTKNSRKIKGLGTKFNKIKGAEKLSSNSKINKPNKKNNKMHLTKTTLQDKTQSFGKSDFSQQSRLSTARTIRMARKSMISQNLLKVGQHKIESHSNKQVLDAPKERPHLEMLKVKKAEIDPKKKTELEHELLKDYPENETVEIVNWEGTFAPIHGEPYVAPLHHQPDSFWDAIYRSTDPDLPTPPGAEVDALLETTAMPSQSTIHKDKPASLLHTPEVHLNNLDSKAHADLKVLVGHPKGPSKISPHAVPNLSSPSGGSKTSDSKEKTSYNLKNKDKGKKEKKKPKLSPKEKKKKKKEKTEEKESNPGKNFARPPGKIKVSGQGDTDDEMSTTYRPEGAYEYPSFRHPDFNPDTAYDENGIPIHESPGWTPPPTLPGDHRFGREKRPQYAGPSLSNPMIHQGKIKMSIQGDEDEELSTTYRPEGAYEYPSFRHPDFNPDTAYDENGIPIHESPGWTPPPTLPGDHRFGRERRPQYAGTSLPIPMIHQVQGMDNIGHHKIHKRKVAESRESLSTSSIMTTKELNMAAERHRKQQASKEYRAYSAYPDSEETVVLADGNPIEAYEQRKPVHTRPTRRVPQESSTVTFPFRVKMPGSKLTDSELLEKEDSAPLEALNPALYMHRNMFQARRKTNMKRPNINDNTEVVAVIVGPDNAKNQMVRLGKLGELRSPVLDKQKKEPENNPATKPHIGNEALNPLLYKHRNMFTVGNIVDDGLKISQGLGNSANRNNAKQMDLTKTMPLDEYLKGNTLQGRGRENFNPFFINNNKIFQVNTNKLKPISEEHIIAKRQTNKGIKKINTRNKLELAGGSPGAGRPKSLRRKTKDDEDSFASYFDGVDPDVVEEDDESTTTQRTTTISFIEIDPSEFMPRKSNRTYQRGVRHTPSTQPPEPKHYSWNKDFLSREEHLPFYVGNQVPDPGLRRPHLRQDSSLFYVDEIKKTGQEEGIIKTRAQILHKLIKKMRPKWRNELEVLDLNPDNTTIEFTNSMQVEVDNCIRAHLLTGHPGEDTLTTMTDEVYKIARERHKRNKSIGHILKGVPPKREPLLRGTVHMKGGLGEYHLKYQPMDGPGDSQEMNGTINLHGVRLNMTHKNAASKLLRNILTLRPRDLTYSQADNALSKIFSSGVETNVKTTIGTRRRVEKVVSTTELCISTSRYSDVGITEDSSASKPIPMELKVTPVLTTASQRVNSNSLYSHFVKEEKTRSLESINESMATPTKSCPEISTSTQSSYFDEINKLRDTMTMGRNISSILMKEMEVKQRETNKGQAQRSINEYVDKLPTVGSWKLQQRIRDFKPSRSYPTLPPFVRKWPTFRSYPKTQMTISETLSSGPDHISTYYTMRPKYKGPRHEPFFFDDFKRIRTIYPSMLTTVKAVHSTDVSSHISMAGSQINELVETTTHKSEVVQRTDGDVELADYTTISSINIPYRDVTEFKFSSEILDKNKYQNEQIRRDGSLKETDFHISTQFPLMSEYESFRTTEPSIIKQHTSMKSTKPSLVTLNVAGKIHTIRPIFIRTTIKVPTTTHYPTHKTTTTKKTHFHVIKHHIKKGLNKLFSVFGFGKSKKE